MRSGATIGVTRDIEAEIREIPGNTGVGNPIGEAELKSEIGWIQSPCKCRTNL